MKLERLQEILARAKAKRIAVAGDLMLDEFVWGRVSRISPEAPVPVVEVMSESAYPGGAANVARNLREFTRHTDILGLIGKLITQLVDHVLDLLKLLQDFFLIGRLRLRRADAGGDHRQAQEHAGGADGPDARAAQLHAHGILQQHGNPPIEIRTRSRNPRGRQRSGRGSGETQ